MLKLARAQTIARGDSRSLVARRPSRRARWVLFGVIAACVAGFYASGLYRYFSWDAIRSHLDTLQALARERLPLALLLFLLTYVAVTGLSLPVATVLTLLAGALFGRWLGTAVVSVASTLGATLAFLLSRFLLRDWVERRFGERLRAVNRGFEKDGAYYLLTLRLVPVFPYYLVNLTLGLTPIRVATFAWVSWLGMLPGTFVYVNAGTAIATIDSPSDIFTVKILIALALLGIVPLTIRKLVQWHVTWRRFAAVLVGLIIIAAGAAAVRTYFRYRTADSMAIAVREYSNAEYPEDPADRSAYFGQYTGRRLTLHKKGDTHFDFVLDSDQPHVARVIFKDVDVSLMTPSLPEWTKDDEGLRRIALTDRQWNRQQVRFGAPGTPHVEV